MIKSTLLATFAVSIGLAFSAPVLADTTSSKEVTGKTFDAKELADANKICATHTDSLKAKETCIGLYEQLAICKGDAQPMYAVCSQAYEQLLAHFGGYEEYRAAIRVALD
ncbi:hypothetical protein GCM10007094_18020 [Pseudovibrio japonicus]|uniref:Cysteine rich repeat domain protein n=1 Tax=Pseudovibrio japonicus TaxID=366534 RepID=A0ABQ3EEM7_9HYPH|nr:hypothetical protein [Pseudovibrio japonicus]GHB30016.1 hypothetical protein GCM10007094_18020 [Pseudovibrio japonicus]